MTIEKENSKYTGSPPHAVILAGGFGTRLKTTLPNSPKSLAPVSGRPFLEYQLDWLKSQGVISITLAIHYLADQIQAFVSGWKDPARAPGIGSVAASPAETPSSHVRRGGPSLSPVRPSHPPHGPSGTRRKRRCVPYLLPGRRPTNGSVSAKEIPPPGTNRGGRNHTKDR